MQAHVERKFAGNGRLAEEFQYIQQASTRKLENWQRWKSNAIDEGRWTDWQLDREEEGEKEEGEKFRDPFAARRNARRRRRASQRNFEQREDLQEKIATQERKDLREWKRECARVQKHYSPKGDSNEKLPRKPVPLLSFVAPAKALHKRHFLEPSSESDKLAFDIYNFFQPPKEADTDVAAGKQKRGRTGRKGRDVVSTAAPKSAEQRLRREKQKRRKAEKAWRKKAGGGGTRNMSVVERQRAATAAAAAASKWNDCKWRFRVWWRGYWSAVRIQANYRGHAARRKIAFWRWEPRALQRRWAMYSIQRVWRGHRGRVAFRRRWVLHTTAAVFIQRTFNNKKLATHPLCPF